MTPERIMKIIDEMKHSIAKLHDQARMLEAAVAGENPVGEVVLFWRDEWHRVYGAKYDLTVRDKGNFKRLTTTHGKVEMKQRIARYLADRDTFLSRQKHPLSIFFTRVSAYATPAPLPRNQADYELATPADCRHEPPCRDDAQHTSLRQREMRA